MKKTYERPFSLIYSADYMHAVCGSKKYHDNGNHNGFDHSEHCGFDDDWEYGKHF